MSKYVAPQAPEHLTILGGDSGIGRSLYSRLPQGQCRKITRSGGNDVLKVAAYEGAKPDWFEKSDTVVNCVGIASGEEATLDRLNRVTALSAARAARDAGARRFVQISSFSVYGQAARIDEFTPISPVSRYGCSKAKADVELLQLASSSFAVQCLRLPAIIGAGRAGKMNQLIRFWRAVRILPTPQGDIYRSVISVDLSATAILELPETSGVFHAADPIPFSYGLLKQAIRTSCRKAVFSMDLPATLISVARIAAPTSQASLWGESLLDSRANILARADSDLFETLQEMAVKQ